MKKLSRDVLAKGLEEFLQVTPMTDEERELIVKAAFNVLERLNNSPILAHVENVPKQTMKRFTQEEYEKVKRDLTSL